MGHFPEPRFFHSYTGHSWVTGRRKPDCLEQVWCSVPVGGVLSSSRAEPLKPTTSVGLRSHCASSLPTASAGPSPTQARPSAAGEPGGHPHLSPGPAAVDALGSSLALIEGGRAGCPISFHWGLTLGLQTQSLQGPGAGQCGWGWDL